MRLDMLPAIIDPYWSGRSLCGWISDRNAPCWGWSEIRWFPAQSRSIRRSQTDPEDKYPASKTDRWEIYRKNQTVPPISIKTDTSFCLPSWMILSVGECAGKTIQSKISDLNIIHENPDFYNAVFAKVKYKLVDLRNLSSLFRSIP